MLYERRGCHVYSLKATWFDLTVCVSGVGAYAPTVREIHNFLGYLILWCNCLSFIVRSIIQAVWYAMTFFDCTADLVGQLNGNGQKGMLQIDAPPVENFWIRHWSVCLSYASTAQKRCILGLWLLSDANGKPHAGSRTQSSARPWSKRAGEYRVAAIGATLANSVIYPDDRHRIDKYLDTLL